MALPEAAVRESAAKQGGNTVMLVVLGASRGVFYFAAEEQNLYVI